jgi:gluconate 2-dehydrogenase gamma chain
MSDQENDLSRREILRNIGLIALSGSVPLEAAQHVHHEVAQQKKSGTPYSPALLNPHEYETLAKLTELVIPPDEHSQGALAAGAPEFIDFMCSRNREIAEIFTGGLGWLDSEMRRRHGTAFLDARAGQQTALLDQIAYKENETAETAPGVRFFTWLRNLTVDAYYTSKVGMDDLGFMGNAAVSEFKVPQEAIDYALKRSGL